MKRTTVAVWLVLAVGVLASSAPAGAAPGDWYQAARFGAYYLTDPCCSSDPLDGTSAAINVSSISPGTVHCILYRSTAETSSQLIQAGLTRCASGYSIDGSCSLSNNFVKYVEVLSGGVYTCYPHGAASTGTNYSVSVQNASSTTWFAFINGTSYESTSMPDAVAIAESGERSGTDSCSGWSGSATFASGGLFPWQRYVRGSATWVNVQSSYTHAGCWTLAGGPPSSFTISH